MKHLDLQVIEQALAWNKAGDDVWLCTVLATFGSSPREPGSWLVVRQDGRHVGSLSGGCVEEDFFERLRSGEFDRPVSVLRYGDPEGPQGPLITLPCGSILETLVERLAPTSQTQQHLEILHSALSGQRHLLRQIDLSTGEFDLQEDSGVGPRVTLTRENSQAQVRIGPSARLIIAGISPVGKCCAQYATSLGFEVIVCDPREEELTSFDVPGVEPWHGLPSQFIASGSCHSATAVVSLTHDPRLDDLSMMEAVRTPAFYIGVIGSKRTSAARAERLRRSGGLSDDEIARLHMPIGLALGSKTPAEIALAVMADILRVQRGKPRDAL